MEIKGVATGGEEIQAQRQQQIAEPHETVAFLSLVPAIFASFRRFRP